MYMSMCFLTELALLASTTMIVCDPLLVPWCLDIYFGHLSVSSSQFVDWTILCMKLPTKYLPTVRASGLSTFQLAVRPNP